MENGTEKIRVVVAIETRIYREGIVQLLEKYDDTELIATATDQSTILDVCGSQVPNILLLDAMTPNALIVAREVKNQNPKIKLIVLAMSACRQDMEIFAREGVSEFVTREDSLEDLRRCIDAAMADGFWCSSRVAELLLTDTPEIAPATKPLINALLQQKSSYSGAAQVLSRPLSKLQVRSSNTGVNNVVVSLTRQQVNVLQFIESGLSNKEIARNLNIETATVKNHVHQILRKLRVSTRGEAAATYRRMAEPYSAA